MAASQETRYALVCTDTGVDIDLVLQPSTFLDHGRSSIDRRKSEKVHTDIGDFLTHPRGPAAAPSPPSGPIGYRIEALPCLRDTAGLGVSRSREQSLSAWRLWTGVCGGAGWRAAYRVSLSGWKCKSTLMQSAKDYSEREMVAVPEIPRLEWRPYFIAPRNDSLYRSTPDTHAP